MLLGLRSSVFSGKQNFCFSLYTGRVLRFKAYQQIMLPASYNENSLSLVYGLTFYR